MPHRIPSWRPLCAAAFLAVLLPAPPARAQEEPLRLEGLVVTATPVPVSLTALGAHVTLLDGEALRARGVTRITDALRTLPGVSVVENGSPGSVASLFMRGGESDFVQVMVDGVQVNQPGGSFDFSGLTMAAVERIEIVRGPASALHGSDAVAGVIHILTRDGYRAPPARLSVRGGSFGRLDGTLAVAGGGVDASYGVTLSRTTTDGILPFNNAHDNTVLGGKASFRLDDRTRARLSGRFGERRYHFPTDFTGALADRNQFTFTDESSFSAEVEHGVGEGVTLRALVSSYAVEGGTDDAPDSPSDTLGFFGYQSLDAYRRGAVDLRASVRVTRGISATVGGEYEEQRVRSFNESRSQFGTSTGRSRNERGNRAAYLHLVAEDGALGGNAGVRYEDNEYFGAFPTWQVGVSYRPGRGLRLRAAAGRGIKEPTFFETFSSGFTVGNPELDPERSTSWEVGVEQVLFDGRVRLEATWFDQEFRDLIQYTATSPSPGAPNYFNVAAATSRGVEAGASGSVGDWRVGADLTWLRTRVTDAGFAQGAGASFVEGESLLRRPEVTVSAFLGWSPDPRVELELRARRVGLRQDRDFSTFPAEPVRLDRYQTLDLSVRWSVLEVRRRRPGFDLTLDVANLWDEAYQEVHGFAAPGRGVYVGGQVTLGR